MSGTQSITERAKPPVIQYLEDFLKSARACDTEVQRIRGELGDVLRAVGRGHVTVDLNNRVDDLTLELMDALDELYAAIAPHALRRAEDLERALPAYVSAVYNLMEDPDELGRTMQPLFEQAGVGERFLHAKRTEED